MCIPIDMARGKHRFARKHSEACKTRSDSVQQTFAGLIWPSWSVDTVARMQVGKTARKCNMSTHSCAGNGVRPVADEQGRPALAAVRGAHTRANPVRPAAHNRTLAARSRHAADPAAVPASPQIPQLPRLLLTVPCCCSCHCLL